MARLKDRHRSLAREAFWDEHGKDSYECPGCGRKHSECESGIEVHHKSGHPLDNRAENLTGMCRLCHMLEEGKKPAQKHIEELRDHYCDIGNQEKQSENIQEKQAVYCQNPQTGETYKLREVHTPQIPYSIEVFIDEHVNTEPKHDEWANPFGFWWDIFNEKFPEGDFTPADLLWGLQEIAGADFGIEDDPGNDVIMVYGVSYQ